LALYDWLIVFAMLPKEKLGEHVIVTFICTNAGIEQLGVAWMEVYESYIPRLCCLRHELRDVGFWADWNAWLCCGLAVLLSDQS
jgi:fumarate reductase subunit D